MKIYILGNGFDLAHNLKTSYWDFRDYLEDTDLEYLIQLEEMYGYYPESKISMVQDNLWKEFEYQLGEIDAESKVDDGKDFYLGLEIEDSGVEDTLDSFWESQYGFINQLNDYVRTWIQQIDISKVKKRRLSIKPKYQDVFLSFNYTLLLEENYKISPGCILHIHGSIDENDIDPVIGHGRSDVEHKLRQSARDASEEYDEKKESICNAMANYIARIQKDTAHYISCNQGFWSSIHDVETVIIMGHSLGEVDMPYFDEIRKRTSVNSKWLYYFYGKEPSTSYIAEKLHISEAMLSIIPSEEFFK